MVINTNFICENKNLNLVIRNNINGDFAVVEKLEEIEPGAFINIVWEDKKLMLPYLPRKNVVSFSDRKWNWRYSINKDGSVNQNNPILYKLLPSGILEEHLCLANET